MHLFLEAKNGEPTVRFRGTLLHSSYDPSREARRFAERAAGAACYLIVGGGLGHLAEALQEARPDSLILTIHPSRELALAAAGAPGAHASPESRPSLAHEMTSAFRAEGQYGFELLIWEPAAKAAPDWCATQQEWALSVAREWHDSLLSTGYFGFRWLRNAFRNLQHRAGSSLPPLPLEKQPVLVAPGPTLDAAVDWISRHRERLFMVAVSSAIPPLAASGIDPDLVVHTDGGYWATHHLWPLLQRRFGTQPPLAAPLRAAFPGGTENALSLLLTDPTSAVERALLPAAPLPRVPIPGHGTVAGTALRLIALLSPRTPILVGLDLASEGLRSHCRGHAFETIFHTMTNRRITLPTVLRDRQGDAAILQDSWRQPRDLSVYAASLAAELGAAEKRCFRLNPSPVFLPCDEMSVAWTPPPPFDSAADHATVPKNRQDSSDKRGRPGHLSFQAPPKQPVAAREVLLHWLRVAKEASPESLLSPTREPGALSEELAQLLALPELLRLRKANREKGEPLGVIEELRRRLVSRVEELLRRVDS